MPGHRDQDLRRLLQSLLNQRPQRQCYLCGSTRHLMRDCFLRRIDPDQLIHQAQAHGQPVRARDNGQPDRNYNRFQPVQQNRAAVPENQDQRRNFDQNNGRYFNVARNGQDHDRRTPPYFSKNSEKRLTNANPNQLTDNRPKVKFSPKVNTLQCENVDIEYMIDDENFVTCILDAVQVYQMQPEDDMVALNAVEVLEQNVQGRQVDLIVPPAEEEHVNETGNSDLNRNHEFKTVKSLSLPDLRKFYSAREFFPGLYAVEPITQPPQPAAEEYPENESENQSTDEAVSDDDDDISSLSEGADDDQCDESEFEETQMEADVEVEVQSENESEIVIIGEYPSSAAVLKIELIQNRLEAIDATPKRKKALKRQKAALLRQIDLKSNKFSEILNFLTTGLLVLFLSLLLPFMEKENYTRKTFKKPKTKKNWRRPLPRSKTRSTSSLGPDN